MLAERLDIFRRHLRQPVTAGSTFQRRSDDNTVETAHVLSVGDDELGIAHVRFHVNIQRGRTSFVDEERILALQSFAERYRERVDA